MRQSRQSRLHQFFLTLWYRQSLSTRLLAYCFLPLSCFFRILASIKRKQDSRQAKKLSVPVIVVGNITVGGTGKTPVVIALAGALKHQNKRVGIISRGYGGTHERAAEAAPLIVTSDTSVVVSGDESLLIAKETQCPVVISRHRSHAAEYLIANFPEIDIIISDDGLQHYKLFRALEIVVVDNNRGLGNQHCLPAGPLREPMERLNDVDWILLNTQKDDEVESSTQKINRSLSAIRCQLASVTLEPSAWFNIGSQTHCKLDEPTWLKHHIDTNQPAVTAIAAIGNPQRFFDTVASLNINAKALAFDDHHKFEKHDFTADANHIVLMTSKDAVKCNSFANDYCWALNVSLQLPTALIDEVVAIINQSAKELAIGSQ